jgi:hypothetical protein
MKKEIYNQVLTEIDTPVNEHYEQCLFLYKEHMLSTAYDNAFNMDFEYGYLDLMTNFGTFISRTQELYSNMETCISSIIETQTERRRLIATRRNTRSNYMRQYLVNNDDDDDDEDNDVNDNNNDLVDSHDSHSSHAPHESNTEIHTNDTNARDSDTNTNTNTNTRRDLFDIASVVYSIPRTVLLNPDTTSNNIINRRRNGGLTITEIEENTEIVSYNSILSNDILNTECPITRETFTPQSVVLRLKQCKHCFVPFRMMTWLETHATCPLCRCNVIQNTANTQAEVNNTTNATTNATTTDNSIRESNINISNLFNNLIRSNSNDFNNLSIDNVNDNSIVFSFDMPTSSLPSEGNANSTLLPQIERLMANTLYGNMYNRQTTPVAPVAPTSTTTTATTTTTNSSNSTNTSDTTNTYVNNNFNNYPDLD